MAHLWTVQTKGYMEPYLDYMFNGQYYNGPHVLCRGQAANIVRSNPRVETGYSWDSVNALRSAQRALSPLGGEAPNNLSPDHFDAHTRRPSQWQSRLRPIAHPRPSTTHTTPNPLCAMRLRSASRRPPSVRSPVPARTHSVPTTRAPSASLLAREAP